MWGIRQGGRTTNYVNVMMSDIDGDVSSKRTVMFIAVFIMVGILVSTSFFGVVIPQFMFDGFLYLAVAGLASTASEKLLRNMGNRGGRGHYGGPMDGFDSPSMELPEEQGYDEPEGPTAR